MANFLKNLITGTAKNLITNTINNAVNKNSSTNVKGASVTQPTQYKTPAQPPVKTTTPVKTTPIIQNVKPVNTQYATPVNSTPAVNNQSRFIGFQNNFWVQNQFTQQAQNVINWNTAQQNITQAWINNKKKEVLTIPTIAETVKKNNNTKAQNYIKQMKVVQDFEADVYKNNWQMTQEQVARLYPEFAGNLPKAMELQKALYPIVKNWEYVDETQIRKYFPEILEDPKLSNYNSKQLEITSKLLNAWLTGSTKKFTRLLEEDGDVLTSRGQQYLQSLIELSNVAKNYRKNYNIKWNPTDADILLYAMQNDENVKNLVQQAQALELTELDKATISRSSDSNIINLLSDYQKSLRTASNEYQRNIQNPVNEWIESGLQALENQWIWTQTPRVFSSIVKTPVNMVWGILWGQNKLTTATDRLLLGQEENAGQVATDLFKAWAGWLETYFNVWMPLATAIYYTATNTKEWEVANEWTLWLFNEWIDNILSGKEWVWAINWLKLSQDNTIVQWYNSLDDETKADVQLDITTAVLHLFHKSTKADRDYIWLRVDTAKDAIVDAFQKWKWASYFQAWVEEWLKKNNNWQVQKWAVKRIVREWINEFWDALKQNFSRFNEVVKAREEARRTAPQTEWGVVPQDNNILRDNRTFGEKAKSTVKNTYNDIASKTKDIFKKEDKTEVVETKNEVTAKEPEVDENWWMKPQETTMNKVTSWIWKTIDKAVETVKKPVNKVAEVVADTFTANSTPQDKLFKAVNPSHNILSNKKGNFQKKRSNSDRTNQLIIEYWHQPTNSAEYYANLIATKQQLWKENIAKGLDEHKFTEVDTKWIVASVLDELWVKPDHLLESNRGSYDKLQAELQSLLDKQKITLEHIESIKQQLNAKLNYWKPVEEGQIYEEWMRILNRKLSEIEDTMISEIPWEFNKFKRDYWALKDMEQDVLKMWLRDMKKKNWGWGLIKNVWRIEAIGNAIDKPLTATLQWIMWEATDMARDNDYLISKWFEQLAQQFKGERKTLNIKQKPWEEWGEITAEEPKWPTPSTPKNEITSKTPKKDTKKPEKKSEKKPVEQKKEELKNEITKKEEPKKKETVKKAEEPKKEEPKALEVKKEEPKNELTAKKETVETPKKDDTATKINNIKSFDDLSNMFEFEKPWEKADWYYVWTLNWVKTQVWEHWSTIFVKYWDAKETPAQSSISKNEPDHIDQLKELLSEINNDGEILETNRNNYNPAKKNEVTWSKNELTQPKEQVEYWESWYKKYTDEINEINKQLAEMQVNADKEFFIEGKMAKINKKAFYKGSYKLDELYKSDKYHELEKKKHEIADKRYNLTQSDNERREWKNNNPETTIADIIDKTISSEVTSKTGWITKQKWNSRNSKFTNTILDVIESNWGLKDWYLRVEVDWLEPLNIEKIWKNKIAISQTYIQNGDVMHDPEIVFKVWDDGKLYADTYTNEWVWMYDRPVSASDAFLDTWNANLKDFIKKDSKKDLKSSENTNIISNKNDLTSNPNNNGNTNLWTSTQTVWWSNQWVWWWNLRNEVSNLQSNEWNKTWIQRTSSSNGSTEMNTSWKSTNLSWNGSTTWLESSGVKTVGQQRKINEESRNILEKHNFSTSRSDYTQDELNTLFQYEWNWGLAKAWDENIKGTRYEYYTPKNAVDALQRWLEKYTDKAIESVEDPTAGKWNMLAWFGDNVKKVMYEISPISWTIAKLRFPDAKVWIGEKDGDFQRRYLNYQGQKAYDFPRDGSNNVDALLINPPFGKRITIKDEPKIKALEDYFVKRAIEHDLRFNGVAGLLMPSRWLKAEDSITKQWLANNTEFIDAYRLPAWVFSYTDVGTDLIILKKKSGVDNASMFFDDNYFKENPDKVLWVEKERSTRHWMETYIDWDPNVINTLWTDNTAPVKMNSLTETPKTEITAKTQAPVENMPKNLITNPEQAKIEPKTEEKSENMEFKPDKQAQKTAEAKKDTEKKPAKRGKNEKITTSKWTKTDIWTYEANWNAVSYKYQGMTNADWYIEDISVWEFKDAKVLNFIDNKAQIDDLYFAGNIYEKLSQLEKDKETIINKFWEEQYNKQKQWLEKVLPPKLTVEDITWSPTDKEILKLETSQLRTYYDYSIREDVTEKKTVQQVFEDWMWKKWNDEFVWTDTDKRKIMNYVKGKKWQWERLSQRYNESDAEFELRKKNKRAEEEQSKQATRERAKTFFNDFVKLELDKDVQDKITEEYNTRLRAVVKPDYKHMPLQVKDMSATFHWNPLVIDPVQIEWINAMLSKGSMLIAHGVWYWKTLEWVIATVWSMQRWWTKRPLMIVPKWTRQDWINTIHDLFPNQEVIDLWGLDAGDIKRLRKDLGDDPSKWVKDWQIAIITHPWFDGKINFKSTTQAELQEDLRDVMGSEENTARQDDALSENIENIAETINKKKDSKKLRGIKWELSAKYGDEILEQLDSDLENMSKDKFVENFVSKVSELERFKETPEEVLKADAEAMYETKPIFLEDLWIDHITIDEVHNYKNIFTSAKLKKGKKWESTWETNPYGSISGSSSSRGRKMFATSQYILKKNNWRWVFSLSATPFNNQPIEVYNMLSLHAYNRLVEKWIQNINSFFDHFADFRTEFIANALKKWWWEYWQVMKDFNNLPEMQRLIGEYIDYVWDNPNLVRPEKRMKKVVLTPSDKQREVQEYLQKKEAQIAASKWSWNKESVLPLYTDMRLNIISPYLTSYGKLNYDVPTAKEFIESSPKLKFAVDTIKALRDEGRNDWVFIYMPYWIEYHSLLQQAIEEAVGKDKVKVWIINGSTTWTETVDGEKVEKRIAIADKFRKWELNVLIWGRNTVEWINLQDNWFITINTLIWWNPTEITQLNGRIHRQGNLRDHVIELLPLLTDWWDVMMMQKYDEKANRINNIFESQGRTFNLEELDPEEEKMALNTDPKRKAELSIDIDKKKLDKDIQKYTAQNWTLNDIINRMPEEDDIKYYKDEVEKLQKESKEIKEAMKALNPESSAYSSLSWDFDSKQRQLKNAKERLKDKEKDLQWATAKMNSYAIDNIEWVKARIDENKQKISELVDTQNKLEKELPERIAKFQKEYEEWKKNMKTPEEYIEDLKEDFRRLKVFWDRQELKNYLETKKAQNQPKNAVTANSKNELTSR